VLFVLSEVSPADVVSAQTATIANHDIVTLPNTRHFVFLDDPPAFYATVDRFLARYPSELANR
jgi:pimeloyl-ACP methyl ester carboxylesterase